MELVYSDRLYEWNPKKFFECQIAVWGDYSQMFGSRKKSDIQKFLSLYFGRDLKLLKIECEENASNGYPYWVFHFRFVS